MKIPLIFIDTCIMHSFKRCKRVVQKELFYVSKQEENWLKDLLQYLNWSDEEVELQWKLKETDREELILKYFARKKPYAGVNASRFIRQNLL